MPERVIPQHNRWTEDEAIGRARGNAQCKQELHGLTASRVRMNSFSSIAMVFRPGAAGAALDCLAIVLCETELLVERLGSGMEKRWKIGREE